MDFQQRKKIIMAYFDKKIESDWNRKIHTPFIFQNSVKIIFDINSTSKINSCNYFFLNIFFSKVATRWRVRSSSSSRQSRKRREMKRNWKKEKKIYKKKFFAPKKFFSRSFSDKYWKTVWVASSSSEIRKMNPSFQSSMVELEWA